MKTSNILVAGLIGGVVAFLLGFLLYGMLLADFFASHNVTAGVMKTDEQMNYVPLALGHLAWGLLLAIIFGRWASISTFETGAKAGAVIGLLMSLTVNLINLGTANILTTTGHMADIAIVTIVSAIAGGAIAWYLGRGK